MTDFSFVMTIFFLLVGPVKIIPAFARITRDADLSVKRGLAIKATVLATAICAIVALFTRNFVDKYHLSLPAIQITGGLILLISALTTLFPRRASSAPVSKQPGDWQLAMSPLATPVIVTPAGIAAIMIFVLLAERGADQTPGGFQAILVALAIVMALNFLVMYFNDPILKIPGLLPALQLFGSVLVVVQGALAVQVLLFGYHSVVGRMPY
jgi:multiple antibiotic resistance protein